MVGDGSSDEESADSDVEGSGGCKPLKGYPYLVPTNANEELDLVSQAYVGLTFIYELLNILETRFVKYGWWGILDVCKIRLVLRQSTLTGCGDSSITEISGRPINAR